LESWRLTSELRPATPYGIGRRGSSFGAARFFFTTFFAGFFFVSLRRRLLLLRRHRRLGGRLLPLELLGLRTPGLGTHWLDAPHEQRDDHGQPAEAQHLARPAYT
jgi:hypothetical protein